MRSHCRRIAWPADVYLALVILFGQPTAHAGESRKPNLLFIMTDQQRFDAMSCAGNTVLKTPNLDRFAREGVMFENAYSANPVCVPSRAIFLTGLSSMNVRVESNGDYTSNKVPNVPTFDSILKKNGYSAEYYGKWHTPYQFTACYDNHVKPVGNDQKVPHIIKAYQAWLKTKGVTPKEPGDGELYSGRNNRPYRPIKLDYNHDKAQASPLEKSKLKASSQRSMAVSICRRVFPTRHSLLKKQWRRSTV